MLVIKIFLYFFFYSFWHYYLVLDVVIFTTNFQLHPFTSFFSLPIWGDWNGINYYFNFIINFIIIKFLFYSYNYKIIIHLYFVIFFFGNTAFFFSLARLINIFAVLFTRASVTISFPIFINATSMLKLLRGASSVVSA